MHSVMEMNQLKDNWEINAACNWVIHLRYIFLSQSVFIFLPSERLLCHHFLGGSVCKGQKTKTKAQGGGKVSWEELLIYIIQRPHAVSGRI